MEKIWAEIKNGLVVNTFLWDGVSTYESQHFISETPNNLNVCIGWAYLDGVFYPPKPFDSWVWDEIKHDWVAPVPRPNEDDLYFWDENKGDWIFVRFGTPDYEVE